MNRHISARQVTHEQMLINRQVTHEHTYQPDRSHMNRQTHIKRQVTHEQTYIRQTGHT